MIINTRYWSKDGANGAGTTGVTGGSLTKATTGQLTSTPGISTTLVFETVVTCRKLVNLRKVFNQFKLRFSGLSGGYFNIDFFFEKECNRFTAEINRIVMPEATAIKIFKEALLDSKRKAPAKYTLYLF